MGAGGGGGYPYVANLLSLVKLNCLGECSFASNWSFSHRVISYSHWGSKSWCR